MNIFLDKESFEKPVWVCIEGPYLYMANSLKELYQILETEYQDDKHLVG